jgi:hypothetical protein
MAMRQIQIGSIVLAKGERMLRRVLAIKDDHARCEALNGSPHRWFSLSQLSLSGNGPALKTHLL